MMKEQDYCLLNKNFNFHFEETILKNQFKENILKRAYIKVGSLFIIFQGFFTMTFILYTYINYYVYIHNILNDNSYSLQ